MLTKKAEEYIYSDHFLRDWLLSTLVIVFSMVLTTIMYPIVSESPLGDVIMDQIEQLLEKTADTTTLNPISLMILIILNNIRVALVLALTSPTLILPLGLEAFQGAAVGYMVSMILHEDTVTTPDIPAMEPLSIHYGLVPHGVVEIPAISLIAAPLLGLRRHGFKQAIVLSFSMLPLTITMLVIAGIVESTVTLILLLLIIALKILVA